MSIARQVCDDTANILKKYSFFKEIAVVPQDSKAILFEMKNALGRQGIIIVVSAKSVAWQGYLDYGSQYVGAYDVDLEITAIENPAVSRSKLSLTGQDAILEAAYILSRSDQKYSLGKYSQYEDGQLVANSIEAKCLALEDAVVPERPKTADDYIKEGLVAMWDGEENIGFGKHDPNATTWKDLVGNCDLSAIGDIGGFAPKAAVIDQPSSYWSPGITKTNAVIGLMPRNADQTLEVVVTDQHTAIARYFQGPLTLPIFGYITSYTRFAMAWNYSGATYRPALRVQRTAPTTESFSIRYTRTDDNKALYGQSLNINTESQALNSEFLWRGNTSDIRIGNSIYNGKFSIHSVRLYNRPLTEDEIRHNYEIDKARFPLTDMSAIPTTLEDTAENAPVAIADFKDNLIEESTEND